MSIEERTYTVKDIMSRWRCSYSRALKIMHAKDMEVYDIGKELQVTESSLLKYEELYLRKENFERTNEVINKIRENRKKKIKKPIGI